MLLLLDSSCLCFPWPWCTALVHSIPNVLKEILYEILMKYFWFFIGLEHTFALDIFGCFNLKVFHILKLIYRFLPFSNFKTLKTFTPTTDCEPTIELQYSFRLGHSVDIEHLPVYCRSYIVIVVLIYIVAFSVHVSYLDI